MHREKKSLLDRGAHAGTISSPSPDPIVNKGFSRFAKRSAAPTGNSLANDSNRLTDLSLPMVFRIPWELPKSVPPSGGEKGGRNYLCNFFQKDVFQQPETVSGSWFVCSACRTEPLGKDDASAPFWNRFRHGMDSLPNCYYYIMLNSCQVNPNHTVFYFFVYLYCFFDKPPSERV